MDDGPESQRKVVRSSDGSIPPDITPQPDAAVPLDYAPPVGKPRWTVMRVLAIAYAAVAMLFGALFALDAMLWLSRSGADLTTNDQAADRRAAIAFAACAAILWASAVWCGRLGLRGGRSRA
jgi:hypothetical protein